MTNDAHFQVTFLHFLSKTLKNKLGCKEYHLEIEKPLGQECKGEPASSSSYHSP